jgi:hypothetical protein
LEKDLDIQSALGALAEALRGTPMATALGDAALEVIERGNPREMDAVRAAGWELAPNALDRIVAVIERTPRTLPDAWIVQLYAAALSLDRADARVLQRLEADARRTGSSPELLELAAKYAPEWFVENIVTLQPPVNSRLSYWMSLLPENYRLPFLSAVMQLGEEYARSLVKQVLAGADKGRALLPFLHAHPAFASRSLPPSGDS